MDDSLRLMRIREQPIQGGENLLVVDQLEKGFLRLYEYMGGSLYIPMETEEMSSCSNAALVAELEVTVRPERKEVKLDRLSNEYGYGYEDLLKKQLVHFADFYGYAIVILDLGKGGQSCA